MGKFKDAKHYLGSFSNVENLFNGPEIYEREGAAVERLRRLLAHNGSPHLQYSVFHIAGTKGKGSTTALLESVLRSAGHRSGYFISPQINRWNEEITICGQEISDEQFVRVLETIKAWNEKYDAEQPGAPGLLKRFAQKCYDRYQPSKSPRRHAKRAFDHVLCMALQHWVENKVDVAVVETGLGGLIDSSNVFTVPPVKKGSFHVNVITPMGLEHTYAFGDTMAKVLRHKLGIVQPHALTVLSPQVPRFADEVKSTAQKRVREVQGIGAFDASELLPVEVQNSGATTRARFGCHRDALITWAANARTVRSSLLPIESLELFDALCSGLDVRLSLVGRHQVDNMRTVIGALLCGAMQGLKIDSRAVCSGAASTVWPGRFEILSAEPLIIADVAHEPLSAAALGDTFRDIFGKMETIVLCGFQSDKDVATIAESIAQRVNLAEVICCSLTKTKRPRDAQDCKAAIESALQVPVTAIDAIPQAVDTAMSRQKPGQALVIFGSFYLLGAATRAVRKRYPRPATPALPVP